MIEHGRSQTGRVATFEIKRISVSCVAPHSTQPFAFYRGQSSRSKWVHVCWPRSQGTIWGFKRDGLLGRSGGGITADEATSRREAELVFVSNYRTGKSSFQASYRTWTACRSIIKGRPSYRYHWGLALSKPACRKPPLGCAINGRSTTFVNVAQFQH